MPGSPSPKGRGQRPGLTPRLVGRFPRASVPRPQLPDDVEVQLPRAVKRELRQHVRGRELGQEVAVAMTVAAAAVAQGDPTTAVSCLAWAKAVAPRAPAIRRALGIAHHQRGGHTDALAELRAYRRMGDAHDQDHLIADCLRATGRSTDEVASEIEGMLKAHAPAEPCVEGYLVWARAVAESGDVRTARAVLGRVEGGMLDAAGPGATHRFLWALGEYATQAGDRGAALEAFAPLAALDGDPFGVTERIALLSQGS